jgi:hypothetical protein
VPVVVDFGDLPNAPALSAVCVPVADASNGAVVLAERAKQLGKPAPRYNASGLLCAIDGLPAEGCGQKTADGYAYWSYWHGDTNGWTYSSTGPGGWRARSTTTEGWRFSVGAGNPTDPKPAHSSEPTSICRPIVASTTTTTTRRTTTTTTTRVTTAGVTTTPASTATTDAKTPDGTTKPPSKSTTTSTSAALGDVSGAEERSASKPGSRDVVISPSDDGVPVGALAGVAAIAALAGAGFVIARRRAGE